MFEIWLCTHFIFFLLYFNFSFYIYNYSETPEFNADFQFYSVRFRKFEKFGRTKSKILVFCHFFNFWWFRFDAIELATYMNKPLDSMDFKEKEALNSNSVRSNGIGKNLKIWNLFGKFFYSFRLASVRYSLH